MKKLFPQSLKNIYHLSRAALANVWYGFPSERLTVIGVTGTNGKTTTTQMIAKILEEAGLKIAVASTINFKIGEREWVNDTKLTTMSIFGLQKHLREAVRAGCEYAVIEITSHALDQNRAWGTDFDVAVVTNVTREHLDYHKTMENYSAAKEKLFAGLSEKVNGTSVVNLNMDFADRFLKYGADKKFGYFLETQNPQCLIDTNKIKIEVARDIKMEISGSKFSVNGQQFSLHMPGEFNIENALAAICVGLSQNISIDKISKALLGIEGVPGRMERIENDRGIEIIVDYAVTPDSLKKLYGLIREIRGRRINGEIGDRKIIAVFGSCGERDRGKRPIMGEIVAKAADYAIVANEDPYREDPQRIIDEVFEGVKKHKKENVDSFRVIDRREAIKKALQLAKPGDIVVVSGKGAEETMAIGNKRIPWNDPEVIREVLQELA
jgi:UDP-N-acetylmuramoyl-L-alanyl-D-glutamate--2,6-diaminopimelate ligase